jgi:hypothetical protein
MNIQEGKYYKTRNGLKVGPVKAVNPGGTYVWEGVIHAKEKIDQSWTAAGVYWFEHESVYDIVGPWETEEKPPKQIDQLSYLDFRPRIEKLWKVGRVF